MTPLLASASLLKHSVPAIPNLFWFPKGCSLPSTCCSLCLEHSFLTSSMAKFHSSYRGLRLDVTSYMKSTRLTSSQIGQEPLLDSRGHVAFHHHCSEALGLCTRDTHLHNRHAISIGDLEKEVSLVWLGNHRGGVEVQVGVSICKNIPRILAHGPARLPW